MTPLFSATATHRRSLQSLCWMLYTLLMVASCADTQFIGSSETNPVDPLADEDTDIDQTSDTDEYTNTDEQPPEAAPEDPPAEDPEIEEKEVVEIELEEKDEPEETPEVVVEVEEETVTEEVVAVVEPEEKEETPAPAPQPVVISQKFHSSIDMLEKEVDLLLIVDNSVSMDHEIQQVQDNLKKLITFISSFSSTRVGILSSFSDDYNYQDPHNILDFSSFPHHFFKIDQRVRSWNSLYLASLFIQDELSYTGVKGSEFFRPNSLKAFMVVTDDDSKDFSPEEFVAVLDQHFQRDDIRFYGFIGLPQSPQSQDVYAAPVQHTLASCDIYDRGRIYDRLLSQFLQGALFDICSTDWSHHFDRVARSVVRSVKSSYKLAFHTTQVYEVKIDDKSLALDQVKLVGQTIEFAAGTLPVDHNVPIEVIYEKEED